MFGVFGFSVSSLIKVYIYKFYIPSWEPLYHHVRNENTLLYHKLKLIRTLYKKRNSRKFDNFVNKFHKIRIADCTARATVGCHGNGEGGTPLRDHSFIWD